MKNASLLALALTLAAAACGPPDSEVIDSPPATGGPIACHIVCQYAETISIRAEVAPCSDSEGCSTCESCSNLLDYHAAAFSCENGSGTQIQVIPLECE